MLSFPTLSEDLYQKRGSLREKVGTLELFYQGLDDGLHIARAELDIEGLSRSHNIVSQDGFGILSQLSTRLADLKSQSVFALFSTSNNLIHLASLSERVVRRLPETEAARTFKHIRQRAESDLRSDVPQLVRSGPLEGLELFASWPSRQDGYYACIMGMRSSSLIVSKTMGSSSPISLLMNCIERVEKVAPHWPVLTAAQCL